MTVRQELGRAELRHLKEAQTTQTTTLVEVLTDTLVPLLPRQLKGNSQPYDVRGMVVEIMDKCVTLANVMTAEQFFFDCSILCAGDDSADASIKDGQSGRVFMCTFPGLGRKMRKGGEIVLVPLVKPSVELESIISTMKHSS